MALEEFFAWSGPCLNSRVTSVSKPNQSGTYTRLVDTQVGIRSYYGPFTATDALIRIDFDKQYFIEEIIFV